MVIFIDVDDTFVRSFGHKRIPMPKVLTHIKMLHAQGAQLYCWSSGGAEYARASAKEFGIETCFVGFLPKPEVMIDDLPVAQWRTCLDIHPNAVADEGLPAYESLLKTWR